MPVLLAGLMVPQPAGSCSFNLDPIVQVGLQGEDGTNRLSDISAENPVIIVDTGTPVTLKAFWGSDDSPKNGKIDPNEWDDLSTAGPAAAARLVGSKMSELVSRGGMLDPSTFLQQIFTMKGGRASFRGAPSGGGSCVLKAAIVMPWAPGSALDADYPVSLDPTITLLTGPPTSVTDAFWENPPPFNGNLWFYSDQGAGWGRYSGQTLKAGDRVRRLLPATMTMPGVANWEIPPNGWGSDWKIDVDGTAFFPGKPVMPPGGWLRLPQTSSLTFTFSTPTDPKVFEIQADGYTTMVLNTPDGIEVKWIEYEYTVSNQTDPTAPNVFPTSDATWTGFTGAGNIEAGAAPGQGKQVAFSGTYNNQVDMLIKITKQGRDGGAQRIGTRRILVRDRTGVVWNGYESNADENKSPVINMSTPSALAGGLGTMKVQFVTRNPYWDMSKPQALISGMGVNLQPATSAHLPGNFSAKLRVLVQEVAGYYGVEGEICKIGATGAGVAHGPSNTGFCDCYAVPIPRFVWREIPAPLTITNVHRFNHNGSGIMKSSLTEGGRTVNTKDLSGASVDVDVGQLGPDRYFSVIEADLNVAAAFQQWPVGTNYGRGAQTSSGGTLTDILDRPTNVPINASNDQELFYPSFPSDSTQSPLFFTVVVTNDGSGNNQENDSDTNGANMSATGVVVQRTMVNDWAQSSGVRFSAHRSGIPLTAADAAAMNPAGYALFRPPANFTAGGYGDYGHYSVVDNIPPELYIQVTDSKYDRHFLFGDLRQNIHAMEPEYWAAVDAKGFVPVADDKKNASPSLSKTQAIDTLAYTYDQNAGTDQAGLLSQNQLVDGNRFMPSVFGINSTAGLPSPYPRYWADEDTALEFRVLARDNLNFWVPGTAGIATSFTSPTGQGIHKYPSGSNSWRLIDEPGGVPAGTPNSPFPEYIFRSPNVSAGSGASGECSVEARVADAVGLERRLKVHFSVYDRQMRYYQLEEKRQKVQETDESTPWFQD